MSKQAPFPWLKRFFAECRSTAAVEFALTAPIIILLGLGAVEFSAAVRAELNVDRTARYLAGILQSQKSISAAQLTDYFVAARYMYANGGVNGTLVLSAASINFTNPNFSEKVTTFSDAIGWDASNAATTPKYTALPNAAQVNDATLTDTYDNDSTIIVEASAVYTLPFMPSFFRVIPSSFTLSSIARVRPRYVLQIPSTGF